METKQAMSATKTCKMCFMEIPAQAKKCPHCQHFQNQAYMLLFQPALAIVPWILAFWLLCSVFDKGENYQQYADQIGITEHAMAFGENRGIPMVNIIGTLSNKSPVPWTDLRFQIDVQNATGQRVDTGQVQHYSYVLPAGDALAFKVGFKREFPETNYVSYTIRIVSARDDRARW